MKWWKQYHADMGSPTVIEMMGGLVLTVCAGFAVWLMICVVVACGSKP